MTVKGFAESAGAPRVPSLDASQSAVVALPDDASAVVVGAPGTGKTTTIVEVVAERVLGRGWNPGDVLVLGQSRASATRLRDRLALRLAVPTEGPLARTVASLAFDIVAFARREAGLPAPRLLTGGDQDGDIAQLLEGHVAEGSGPNWSSPLNAAVRAQRGFRTELRETLMRVTEYGLSPTTLRELADANGRPEWSAVADFRAEYLQVMAELRPDQFDAAELTMIAVSSLDAGIVPESVSRLKLVIVDDLQEATHATISVLRALARRGVSVIAFGNPDVASNVFRGGEPDVVGRFGVVLGIPGVASMRLSTSHRQGASLLAFTNAVTDRIGTAETVGHRHPEPTASDGSVAVMTGATPTRLWSSVARRLRESHLANSLSWDRVAVVVRSGALVPTVARALALADVPTRTSVSAVPVRDDIAARALLALVEVGVGRAELTASVAEGLLLGPFGGLDRLGLRRLRLSLRAEELAGDGNRTSDELIVDSLAAPGRLVTIDHDAARKAAALASTLAELHARAAAGATIEELLWLAWDRSSLAPVWRQHALSSGILAAEANRNLDGILAVFTAAKRFVEREPGSTPSAFLAQILDAEVPEDSLSPRQTSDAVLVTTPSGVLGLEFDTVVVAGLQDGAWPNLKPRGSLLFPSELIRAATGAPSALLDSRREVLGDELRMFALAVSRARREVILAAIVNDDEAASVFLALAPADSEKVSASAGAPLSLRGIVGELRRELVSGRGNADEVAANLALLASHGVPGADTEQWHGLLESSTTQPLYLDDETVPVSPSKLGNFEDSPLDWFIESVSGDTSSTAMGLGTIVHWAMEHATDPDVDSLWAAIESRWSELVFDAPWLAAQQKRAARKLASGLAEYLGDSLREGKTVVAAEDRFELEVGRARVRGSIDRVERSPDGGVVIVDLKTGAPETSQSVIDELPQLGAYQLAYASGELEDVLGAWGPHHSEGAKLLFVREGVRGKSYREAIQAPLTPDQLEVFRERVRRAAIGMALGVYEGPAVLDPFAPGDTASRSMHRVRAVSSD